MEQIRVATFDGPGTEPVIRSVPRPEVPDEAALSLSGLAASAAPPSHPCRALAKAAAVALHAGP
jgi:hypothetical protein